MSVTCVIQARVASTRLPGKALLDICGKPMLQRVIERVRRADLKPIVATTTRLENDPISELCSHLDVRCYRWRGHEDDVLGRFIGLAREGDGEIWETCQDTVLVKTFLRVTADCPLVDPDILRALVARWNRGSLDYLHNLAPWSGYPEGLDCEVMSLEALERCRMGSVSMVMGEKTRRLAREHVTYGIRKHSDYFCTDVLRHQGPSYSHLHWSVDTLDDLEWVRAVYAHYGALTFTWRDVLCYVEHGSLA